MFIWSVNTLSTWEPNNNGWQSVEHDELPEGMGLLFAHEFIACPSLLGLCVLNYYDQFLLSLASLLAFPLKGTSPDTQAPKLPRIQRPTCVWRSRPGRALAAAE